MVGTALWLGGDHHQIDSAYVRDPRGGAAFAVGDEQRPNGLDPPFAPHPGLEDPAVGKLTHVGEAQGGAPAGRAHHLGGYARRLPAYLACAVVAAALSGVDPVSMLLEMAPLLALYELSIILARAFGEPSAAPLTTPVEQR